MPSVMIPVGRAKLHRGIGGGDPNGGICDLNWAMCSSIELFPHEHELGLEVKFIFIVGGAVLLVERR